MPRNADRAGHVQVLQGFARDCKVTPVQSDEARRKAVTEMVERIRTSDGPLLRGAVRRQPSRVTKLPLSMLRLPPHRRQLLQPVSVCVGRAFF